MSKLTAQFPLAGIKRLQLYINTGKKTLSQIMAETGADYGINGGLFNGNWTAACHLKADGYVWAEDPYTYWGYAWDAGPDLAMGVVPDAAKRNYICCCALIEPGGPVVKPVYPSALGGKRGRTAIGTKSGSLCLYVTGDGTADAATPETLRDELAGLGWDTAVMLDGGGSSQCSFAGQTIASSRPVHNLILVYLKKDGKKEDSGMELIQRPMTKNRCYTAPVSCAKTRAMLHSTGTPGATAADILAAMDKPAATTSVEFVVDGTGVYQALPLGVRSWHSGASANSTHVACELCEPVQTRVLSANWKALSRGGANNTTYAVKLLQQELAARGYDPKGIDGSFGPGTEAALKAYQTAAGLTADGSCGPATLAKLKGRAGSYLRYPAAEVQAYFDTVYAKAVELFAWLMKEVGGDPAEILCHSEGYKAGIASNHADVLHWFPEHGKTMDDFRADVAAAMAPAMTLAEAVDALAAAGVITAADDWKAGQYSAETVAELIKSMAAYIGKGG